MIKCYYQSMILLRCEERKEERTLRFFVAHLTAPEPTGAALLSWRARMNKEKYRDPTAEAAVANVMREYHKKKQAGGNIGRKSGQKSRGSACAGNLKGA